MTRFLLFSDSKIAANIRANILCYDDNSCDTLLALEHPDFPGNKEFHYTMKSDRNVTGFKIKGYSIETFNPIGTWFEFDLQENNINYIQQHNNRVDAALIEGDTINTWLLLNSSLSKFSLVKTRIRYWSIINTIFDEFSIQAELPDTLVIQGIKSEGKTGFVDFTGFMNGNQKECKLIIGIDDVLRVKFNYSNYKLLFYDLSDPYYDINHKVRNEQYDDAFKQTLYTSIIDHQQKFGFFDGLEKVTKEYKSFNYKRDRNPWGFFSDWLDKHWWDYGYNKGLIFRNTLILFMAFYLLNLFWYRNLSRKVYAIEEFVVNDRSPDKNSLRAIGRYALYTLFYTGYIFFGLKLDYDLLKLRHLGYASYIVLQFVTGIICLAYLANYIISR